jgi:hypothetical protein
MRVWEEKEKEKVRKCLRKEEESQQDESCELVGNKETWAGDEKSDVNKQWWNHGTDQGPGRRPASGVAGGLIGGRVITRLLRRGWWIINYEITSAPVGILQSEDTVQHCSYGPTAPTWLQGGSFFGWNIRVWSLLLLILALGPVRSPLILIITFSGAFQHGKAGKWYGTVTCQ